MHGVKLAEADEGKGTRETLTTAERSELVDLRKIKLFETNGSPRRRKRVAH